MHKYEKYKEKMLQFCDMVLTQPESVSVYNWMYEDGVLLEGLLQAEKLTGDERIFPFVKNYVDAFVTEDGHLPFVEKRAPSVDCINNAKIILEVYKRTGEEKYRKVLEYFYEYIKRHPRLTGTTAFAHKQVYFDQMWLDGLYMLQPFYARMAEAFGCEEDYADVAAQFAYICKFTYDEEKQLFYHAYDHSREMFWSDKETGHSPCFWGRAMGWLGMALVDTLGAIPEKFQKEREILLDVLKKLADGVCRWQNEQGVWYQVVDQGTREGNYMEASCSCMFACFLMKAVQAGYLSEEYIPYIDKALEGIFRQFVTTEEEGMLHVHQVCLVAGLGPAKHPHRDGTFEYYMSEPRVDDDNKARGPLLQLLVSCYKECTREKETI